MVDHPNEFETAVTLGQNEPLYCNVPDSLSKSLARARLTDPVLLLIFYLQQEIKVEWPYLPSLIETSLPGLPGGCSCAFLKLFPSPRGFQACL